MKCKKCGKEIIDESMFCMYCGSKQITNCSSCGTVLPDEAVFCYRCGAKVTDDISSNKEERDGNAHGMISYNPPKSTNNSGIGYVNGVITYDPPKSTNNKCIDHFYFDDNGFMTITPPKNKSEENYWDYIDGFKNPYGKDFYDYVKRKGISFEGHRSEHCVRQRMASMNYDRQCGGLTSYPAERSEAEIFLGLFCDALLSLDDD